jgi:membrane protease YdiL (CAAX protease family)
MFERLGQVLYWIGSALAALFIVGSVFAAIHESNGQNWLVFFFFIVIGVLFWLAGRALKYILSGK